MITEPATLSPTDRRRTVKLLAQRTSQKKKSMKILTQNRNLITITKQTKGSCSVHLCSAH